MSERKNVLTVDIEDSKMMIKFNTNNIAFMLHISKLIEMEIENQIIMCQQPKSSDIITSPVPSSIIDRLK